MAKRPATDGRFTLATDALQLLGGYSYLSDYGMEKIVRNLWVHQILEWANRIMGLTTARHRTAPPSLEHAPQGTISAVIAGAA